MKFAQLIAERDRMFAKHPEDEVHRGHLAYHGHDLTRAAALLEKQQNVYLEVAAVLMILAASRGAAAGSSRRSESRALWEGRVAPSDTPTTGACSIRGDEYFDYYRDYHAFWKLYGMNLPDVVLRELCDENALKVTPGLPATGWPGQ